MRGGHVGRNDMGVLSLICGSLLHAELDIGQFFADQIQFNPWTRGSNPIQSSLGVYD